MKNSIPLIDDLEVVLDIGSVAELIGSCLVMKQLFAALQSTRYCNQIH